MSEWKGEVSDSDIAIIGVACRYAGSPDPETFWKNVRDGVECLSDFSEEELAAAGVSPSLLEDPRYVKRGGVLEGFDHFDAGFFGFGPKDAAILDPQHRNFMELCWEAFESAGHYPARFEGPIGVFAGCGMNAYFMFNLLTNPELVDSTGLFLLRHTGNDRDFLPTTVSYKLNLKGPSVAVQTACSTSLVATHMAIQSLLAGESDMAIAGGVTIEVPHVHGYLYHDGEILARDGHCRAFSQDSTGTVLTSGLGAVVLRRLQDALDDGDHVRAVIKGSAINNDGSQKVGYLAPSVDGQAEVIAEALAVADVEPETIGYIETHGTGTSVGDPIEVSALTQAFQQSTERTGFCGIGSNKPNFGHTDTAAGVASLIKVTAALEHKQLPPSIHYSGPNPEIDFDHSPFYVNTELRDWETDGTPRRAGVSSLGVGGTNAHLILEEAPPREPSTAPARDWQILPFSAKSATSADLALERMAAHLRADPELDLADAAYTLQEGREPFDVRRAIVCRDGEEAVEVLEGADSKRIVRGLAKGPAPSVVFMFPGGGAQYPDMGIQLYETEPVYRAAVDQCIETVAPRLPFDLRQLMFPGEARSPELTERLRSLDAALPAIFTTSYALSALWMSWGIEPAAMTGHSMGEYTAACLANVMSLEDALAIVAVRSQLMTRVIDDGRMLSVPLPEDEVRELMTSDLDLGVINAPALCVVSGNEDAITSFQDKLAGMDIEAQVLNLRASAHSRGLDPVLPEFRAAVEAMDFRAPERPYVSNLTGTWVTEEDVTNPDYWVRHLRETVRFSDGLATLLEDSERVLLEVGPGQTLSSLARQQPTRARASVSSLRHPEDDSPDDRFLLTALGRLWASGVDVDWSKLRADDERRLRIPLPSYAFDRQRYWIAPGEVRHIGKGAARVERLSSIDDWFWRSVWKRVESTPPVETEAPESPGPRRWLVFADGEGLAKPLVQKLRSEGDEVHVVREGDAFYALDQQSYALAPEMGLEGYRELFATLAARDAIPDRILHLWTLTGRSTTPRPGSNLFHHLQERGFYSLFFLAQAMGELDEVPEVELLAVSNGMQQVRGESLEHPAKATLLGPVRVVPRELPSIVCRSLDVELPDGADGEAMGKLAVRVADEFDAEGGNPAVAYRAGQRFEQSYEHFHLPAVGADESLLRDGGVYLVTGGLGGIGLSVAEHLARTCRAKLVLLGRSGLPPRQEWERWLEEHGDRDRTSRKLRKLMEIESTGAEVHVASADIANLQEVQSALGEARKRFGELNGVIHAAGVVEDAVLQTKSQESVERIFTPKLHGTLVLAELLAGVPLDFMVLFSSTSSILGAAGQIDYTAANAFLNAYAESRRTEAQPRVIAIDWGVWNEVGMAMGLTHRMKGRDHEDGFARTRVAHPLLAERLENETNDILFTAEYAPDGLWALDEHRTEAGNAVVPGTGYLEMVRAALSEALGIERCEIHDASFLSPLEVADDATREVRIALHPVDSHWAFEIESRHASDGAWQPHAQGGIHPLVVPEPEAVALVELEARCAERIVGGDGEPIVTAQESFLDFGPRWRAVRRIGFGDGEALAEIELQPDFVSDLDTFALHPALLDMATGYAMELIEGYRPGQTLWVPLSYGRVRVHAPLTREVRSWVRSDPANHVDREVACFDVTICDPTGRVLVEIERFTIRKLARTADFAAGGGAVTAQASIQQLSAGEKLFLETVKAGICVDDGMEALERVLSGKTPPQVVISSIDLDVLVAASAAASDQGRASGTKFERPDLSSAFEAPRDDLERSLAAIWQDLLEVNEIGVHDDFFEIGGHSLIAVRLFAKIKQLYSIDWGISVLFEAPTIAQIAERVRVEVGEAAEESGEVAPTTHRPSFRYLVPLNAGDGTHKAPFFLVAGMFGNVLNLRHLGQHLGKNEPAYAIQARGLLGDDEPHRRFEDMASAYLEEVRQVQPEGPYFLGGFSGGGITALEMAQQLEAEGEEVGILVMLDTPPPGVPHASRLDKVRIHLRRLASEGPAYVSRYVRQRIEWEKSQRHDGEASQDLSPAEFRSERIKVAFYEALDHYRVKPWDGTITLFTPPLGEHWEMGGGRILNHELDEYDPHNHWEPHIRGGVDLHVVTGDHDSMVLEPHVRNLAAHLRACLDAARRGHGGKGE